MELRLGIETDVFEKALKDTLEKHIFQDLSASIEYALKIAMSNYLSKYSNLLIKNDFVMDTVIKCKQPKTLTHGFGFNYLDKELTFELSSIIKIQKMRQDKVEFNPFIKGVVMKYFPIKSGHIRNNKNNEYHLFYFMDGKILSNNYLHEIEFTRIAKKDVAIKELKTQTNIFINKLRFSFRVKNILTQLSPETIEKLQDKMVPEWFYLCDFEMFNSKHQEITYFNLISGKRYICSCSREFHEHLLASNPPTARKDNLLMLSDIVCLPRRNTICHVCIIQKYGFDECKRQFGIPDKTLQYCFGPLSFFYYKDPKWSWIYHNLNYIFNQPKWINENNMFLFAKELLPEFKILREASPTWLGSQSLDVYFPEISLALEYQGRQHFEPVDFFGGETALIKNKERDLRKKELCRQNGVSIVYVYYNESLTLELIKKKLNPFIKKLRSK
ncbi:hypothetical protein DGG96_11305 [Legionella qingyii]|uniref:Uncharacterized protein n=1 Tax=Legionella qingyii TaxID=2184757 RepID=A0A317U183_9GAMM|nr:hypothetical protein [Legionella qingyii]PWY54589.1 hypothetical protein DGG96_16425 [Legionella qingyii]PWY55511.1 hypothetical protein DGG96_11305 [Legionella qingyii]RUR21481.1 hypothetical protein ELY20_12320 [Legionella qingyii]